MPWLDEISRWMAESSPRPSRLSDPGSTPYMKRPILVGKSKWNPSEIGKPKPKDKRLYQVRRDSKLKNKDEYITTRDRRNGGRSRLVEIRLDDPGSTVRKPEARTRNKGYKGYPGSQGSPKRLFVCEPAVADEMSTAVSEGPNGAITSEGGADSGYGGSKSGNADTSQTGRSNRRRKDARSRSPPPSRKQLDDSELDPAHLGDRPPHVDSHNKIRAPSVNQIEAPVRRKNTPLENRPNNTDKPRGPTTVSTRHCERSNRSARDTQPPVPSIHVEPSHDDPQPSDRKQETSSRSPSPESRQAGARASVESYLRDGEEVVVMEQEGAAENEAGTQECSTDKAHEEVNRGSSKQGRAKQRKASPIVERHAGFDIIGEVKDEKNSEAADGQQVNRQDSDQLRVPGDDKKQNVLGERRDGFIHHGLIRCSLWLAELLQLYIRNEATLDRILVLLWGAYHRVLDVKGHSGSTKT